MTHLDLIEARDVATSILRARQGRVPYVVLATDITEALAPLIEAQVRATIAADIEKREAGPGSDHYAHGYTCAIEDAATIARGDA